MSRDVITSIKKDKKNLDALERLQFFYANKISYFYVVYVFLIRPRTLKVIESTTL